MSDVERGFGRVAFAPTGEATIVSGGRNHVISRQESAIPSQKRHSDAMSVENPLRAPGNASNKISASPVVKIVSNQQQHTIPRRRIYMLIIAFVAVAGIVAAAVLGWRMSRSSSGLPDNSAAGDLEASGLTPGSGGAYAGNSSVAVATASQTVPPALPSTSASATVSASSAASQTASVSAAPSQSATLSATPSPSPTPAPWWSRRAYDVASGGALPPVAVALQRSSTSLSLSAIVQTGPLSLDAGSSSAIAIVLGFAIDTAAVLLNATLSPSGQLLASASAALSPISGSSAARMLTDGSPASSALLVSAGPCIGCINFTIPYAWLGLSLPSNSSSPSAPPGTASQPAALSESDAWKRARMAMAVSWLRSDAGSSLMALASAPNSSSEPLLRAFPGGWLEARRERLLHIDGRAASAPFAVDPLAWSPVDMALRDPPPAADAAVTITVTQPFDGKLTVVIDSSNGTRIRNLVSGQAYPAGVHTIAWDATDDAGNLIAPSAGLRWRAISHAGVVPKFLIQFANGNESSLRACCSNHGQFEAAVAAPRLNWAFLGAPLTEGGSSLVAVSGMDDKITQAYVQPLGAGIWSAALAVDEDAGLLYRINDGPGWGTSVGTGSWVVNTSITITRHGIAAGLTVAWPGNAQFCSLLPQYELGPGSRHPALRNTSGTSLRGAAFAGGRIYIAAAHAQAILAVNASTCTLSSGPVIPLPALAGPVAASVVSPLTILYAAAGRDIVRVDLSVRPPAVSVLIRNAAAEPTGLAVGEDDALFVACGASHRIYVYASGASPRSGAAGNLLGAIGAVPAGPYEGPFIEERLVHPAGLAVLGNSLWVTEKRTAPKRASVWDVLYSRASAADGGALISVSARIRGCKGALLAPCCDRLLCLCRLLPYTAFHHGRKLSLADLPHHERSAVTLRLQSAEGNAPYGGPNVGMDPRDPARWLGLGNIWRIDMAAGTARPTHVLSAAGGHLGGLRPWMTHYHFVRVPAANATSSDAGSTGSSSSGPVSASGSGSGERTLLIGMDKMTTISELRADGTIRDLAFFCSAHECL